MKSTDTVLMTLGRKGLTSGAIKGFTVCCLCFTAGGCVFHCKHTAVNDCTVHSHPKQCARVDREEYCF
ncbi:unnamed protein product [Staurois parvus]|uniref:Uncharacterized protein n=1 Tax=Staurois parvus TaxID=386267 RepID=A0ABN9CQ68_9NEOB|nr:unnamed protein product [Staurois parvus]